VTDVEAKQLIMAGTGELVIGGGGNHFKTF